jgi:hypothetical protein
MKKQYLQFNTTEDDYQKILKYLDETIRLFPGSSNLLALKFLGTHSCLLKHLADEIIEKMKYFDLEKG